MLVNKHFRAYFVFLHNKRKNQSAKLPGANLFHVKILASVGNVVSFHCRRLLHRLHVGHVMRNQKHVRLFFMNTQIDPKSDLATQISNYIWLIFSLYSNKSNGFLVCLLLT